MELDEVVMKLVGPVEAVGETNEDARRLKNLKVLTALVDSLLWNISAASISGNREEASMKAIGMHARNFLRDMRAKHEDFYTTLRANREDRPKQREMTMGSPASPL